MLESLQSAFASNSLVGGGVALAAFGLAALWLRELPGRLAKWGKHFFVTTLTADSRDELMFPAPVEYMDSREALRRITVFTVRAVRQQGSSAVTSKFFDHPAAAARFAEAVPADRWSPAQVQERLLKAGNVDEALALFRAPITVEGEVGLRRAA